MHRHARRSLLAAAGLLLVSCFDDKQSPADATPPADAALTDVAEDATHDHGPVADQGADQAVTDVNAGCGDACPPEAFAWDRIVAVPGLHENFNDLHQTPGGALFVASSGPGYVGEIWVTRSADNGRSWQATNLGNEGDCPLEIAPDGTNDLYFGKLFDIDHQTLGVAGIQGTCTPYDGFFRTSDDGGLTYSPSWINFTNSPEGSGARAVEILRTGPGKWIAFFLYAAEVFLSETTALDTWPGSWKAVGSGRQVQLARDGAGVLLAHKQPEPPAFVIRRTDDGGETLTELARLPTNDKALLGDLWRDEATGLLYLCTVEQTTDAAVDWRSSKDGGKSWSAPVRYVEGLAAGPSWAMCSFSVHGLLVGYKDRDVGLGKVLLPRPREATPGCADGTVEQSFGGGRMVACAVDGGAIYDQGICNYGWRICSHTEYLLALGAETPPADHWLNAYLEYSNTPEGQWQQIHDNPDPGCRPHQGQQHVHAIQQASTDTDHKPASQPFVNAAKGLEADGGCATVKLPGAMCCR